MFHRCKSSVRVSAGFCLLIAWFAVINGWKVLTVVLSASAVHELGHWMALRVLGADILGFRIGIFGAVLETDQRSLSYGQELIATLAGPAANLLGAVLLTAGGFETAAGAHLVLGGFNLLPMRPLDGGRACYLMTACLFGPVAGEWITRVAGTVTGTVQAAGLIILMVKSGGNLWLLPAVFGALMAAIQECFGK